MVMKLVKTLFSGLKSLIKKLRPVKDGVIYNKHGYTTYRNGLRYGKFYKRYSDFMFIERGYYKNDKRHCFWNSTNNLEDTQIIGYYVNNTLEGLCNIFNKRELSICVFNNNIPNQLLKNFKITRGFNESVNNSLILNKCFYYL